MVITRAPIFRDRCPLFLAHGYGSLKGPYKVQWSTQV